jgi:hypothetical protein
MRFYEASSKIAAAPHAVWDVLSDGAQWPSWDSGVVGVDGRIAPGETIAIRSGVAPGRAFPVRVATFEPGRQLVLEGGMPLGLFRGVRTYTLSPVATGETWFQMREEYTGVLVPLMWRSMPDLGPSFRQFGDGLKRRVEGSGS